ncbi:MAG TPA: signal recognition particle receptor subunit alpha, partial [Bacteroidia bacterium]|nr:signal recognition particle receptor subunit alpha [Bacteroidia bacterium]
MSFFSKLFSKENKESLDQGLSKTKESFFGKLTKAIAGKSTVDAEVLDQLEEVLISGDVGVSTTIKIIDRIEERVKKDKYVTTSELDRILKEEVSALLKENSGSQAAFIEETKNKPHVIMVVGVNGAGKTKTIGKLAHQFKSAGKTVFL